VVADFNGDGKPDLAVSNSGGPVAVSLGNGDGTFQASQIYGAGKASQSVAVGDFNGDGKLDLVAADGGVVSLLLGNGDGTFQPELNYAGAGGNAGGTSLAVGDFNGDGALDLVTEGVSVLLNRRGTLINVQSSNNPSMFGQTVEFTVTVAAGLQGTGSPTGTVTVRDGATVLGSGALVSGKFVVSTSSLAAGSHRIFAKYSGDCNFQKHTSEALIQTVQQTVQKIPSGTALNSSANPSDFNESVTFTSTVTPDAVTKPSGSVTFWDGTTKLGAGSLNASGSVSFTVSTLTAGKHNITGSYSGDGNFTASMSAAVSQVVNDFQSTASAPTPASVVPGQSATATVTVGPLGGFNIPISLTCSVSPMPALAPTCALDPTSVTPVAGKSTSSTLTIKTTAFSASLTSPSLQRDSRPLYVLCLPIAGLLLFGVASPLNPSRRRKLLGFLAGAALLSGLLFQFACGGGSAINNSSAGTPAGNYTVTINATSGSMAHTTTVTLKVQ
jgi:hypothetical protein